MCVRFPLKDYFLFQYYNVYKNIVFFYVLEKHWELCQTFIYLYTKQIMAFEYQFLVTKYFLIVIVVTNLESYTVNGRNSHTCKYFMCVQVVNIAILKWAIGHSYIPFRKQSTVLTQENRNCIEVIYTDWDQSHPSQCQSLPRVSIRMDTCYALSYTAGL